MRGPLTADEVAELPSGVPIEVVWSGGNGPHRYQVFVDARGRRYAWSGSPRMEMYNPLDFVGLERFHTRVWLVDDGVG